MEILLHFDRNVLNEKIKLKKDKIKYEQIVVDSKYTKEGLLHIAERHLDDIVEAYNKIILKGDISPNEYEKHLNLSVNFIQYYQNLISITEGLHSIHNLFIEYRYNKLCKMFYNPSKSHHDIKDFYAPIKNKKSKREYDNLIENLREKLDSTRNLISAEDLSKIYRSIIRLLDEVASDPDKIWKDGDMHIYISSYYLGKSEHMVMFITQDDGKVISAFKRKPLFKRNERRYIIYRKGNSKNV